MLQYKTKRGDTMGYRLDGKDVDIVGKRMTKIGTGTTGDVYRYKNKALKIFKKGTIPPMNLETAKYLSNISTTNIILPENLLFYNDSFRGYTYKLVSKKGLGKRMITLPKEELIDNIENIEIDTEILSNKNVLLNGIDPSNSIFNGSIYLCDPSKYSILDIMSNKELEKLNKYQIYMLLSTMLLSELRKNNLGGSSERKMKSLLELKDMDEDASVYFDRLLQNSDNVKQFVKKM